MKFKLTRANIVANIVLKFWTSASRSSWDIAKKTCCRTFDPPCINLQACLDELRRNSQELLRVKKLLVFAAILLDYRAITSVRKEKTPGFNSMEQSEENGDVYLENSLPEQYRPNLEVYRWMNLHGEELKQFITCSWHRDLFTRDITKRPRGLRCI